ncbi:MAG: DNA mismatch repair protein MutT [Planctomycetes bacterium]|nr:DNA mismatch repair protein MutT [Planctomycetota bacterium]
MVEMLRVVGAVIERDGKILACRRRPEKAEGSKWEFPGGKVESEESPEQALKRELAEELELHDVQVLSLVERATTASNGKHIDLACYRVEGAELPVTSTDHDSMQWCTPDQLITLDWALADRPIVDSLVSVTAHPEDKRKRTRRAKC